MPAPHQAPPSPARTTVTRTPDDVQRRITEIATALGELAATSEDAFLHVSGQALDTIDGWQRILHTRAAAA